MKIIAILLSFTLLLGLNACVEEFPQATQEAYESATSGTSYEGLFLNLAGIHRTGEDTVITVTWNNETQYNALYGDTFTLQRLIDGQWVYLQTKENTGFNSIGYALAPEASLSKAYTTAWLYGDLQPGTYRFSSGCHVYETQEGVECNLWIEFSLGTLPDETSASDSPGHSGAHQEPPVLTLKYGTAFKEYTAAAYATPPYDTFGYDALFNTDIPMLDELEILETTEFEAFIDFAQKPDDITIRCWSDSQHLALDGQSEDMILNANCFTLKPAIDGGYVYEITVKWSGNGTGYHGVAIYYLYIASYPVTPIQPRG